MGGDFTAENVPLEARRKALIGLLSVTLVWGATFIWMKQALNSVKPEIEEYGINAVVSVIVGARFLIAIILLLIFFKQTRQVSKADWQGGAVLGGLMLCGFVTQMVGLDEINPAVSAFLTSLYVVMTALITTWIVKKPLSKILVLGVLLATFGAGFIEGPPHLSWGIGEVLTVVSALFFALHIIFTQKFTQQLDPVKLTLTSFVLLVLGAVGLLVIFDGFGAVSIVFADGVIVPLLCLGIGGSFFALLVLNLYQRYLNPVQAAIIYAFEPVWATIYGLGIGLVEWTWWIAIGGGALLTGNLVVELLSSKPEKTHLNEEAAPSKS